MSEEQAQQHAREQQARAQAIIAAWQRELQQLGLSDAVSLPCWSEARYELQRDPASDTRSLKGSWRGAHNELRGSVVFHADGSFFGEYDVVRPHPKRSGWFVEAVVAWGRDTTLKSEVRLLPMVE